MMNASSIVSCDQICGLIQRTLNHVDARLVDHGVRVAYIMKQMLLEEGSFQGEDLQDICLVAMLHDIGAYKTDEIDEMVTFDSGDIWQHSVYGYLFLKHLTPLARYAELVLYHHAPAALETRCDPAIKKLAQMLFLADRIDVFALGSEPSVERLLRYLERNRGKQFLPEVIDLFLRVLGKQKHTVHLEEISYAQILPSIYLTDEQIDQYLKMLTYAIDFRSQHTVTHTITTTQISYSIARLMKLQEPLLTKLYYGAMLHDLGKIAIPVEILEYPGKLSPQAMAIMRKHVVYTEDILSNALDDETIAIAARHHEKLDGSGYPHGLDANDLTLAERIVAVADIASALLGTRSYKDSYSKEKTLEVIGEQMRAGKIDAQVAAVLAQNMDSIERDVQRHCKPLLGVYEGIHQQYDDLMERLLSSGRM